MQVEESKIVARIVITYTSNGQVQMSGIPSDPNVGAQVIADITRVMFGFYLQPQAPALVLAKEMPGVRKVN